MKRLQAVVGMALVLLVAMASGASAAEFIIPINTWVEAPPGSVTVLTTVDVPEELIGYSCLTIAVAANGESVHPNNDLIVSSGGDSVVLYDVERASFELTEASGTLVLGPTATVSLLMGGHGQFSGGLDVILDGECTPPPAFIEIVKLATPDTYGSDMIGTFSIMVTNPGPQDLTNVHVTDDVAVALDPDTNCVNDAIGDLAVGESFTYSCTVGNLNGIVFENTAVAIGTPTIGPDVTATSSATVRPVFDTTVTTQPPATTTTTLAGTSTTLAPTTTASPTETLPVTGVDSERLQGFGLVGVGLVFAGIALLGGAALIGRMRDES